MAIMKSPRRFLVVTLDAAGNWPPEIALIRALVQRGHAVRVMSNATHAAEISAAGAQFRPYDEKLERDPTERHDESPEAEMARVMRDVFLNARFAEALLAEVKRDPPDVLLVDQMLLMAAAAAESTGLPTALLWHTVFGGMVAGRRPGGLEPLNAFRADLGLTPIADQLAAARRADAILAFTHEAFDRALPDRPPQLHYVGPLACTQPVDDGALPGQTADARPLVLVSYSTSFQNQVSALQRVADAVANLPVRVLLTLGRAIAADELRLPANVDAQRFVPHAAVLPQARLVVTHAGHGTVMAAVTAGVPLVCTPMGRDQHAVAACVAERELGVVVPATASSDELAAVIASTLADRALYERTQTFAAGLDVKTGLDTAVELLESMRPEGGRAQP
jgi:UDP:flavonoid glycosyltransferase YjiC (YdhE family)